MEKHYETKEEYRTDGLARNTVLERFIHNQGEQAFRFALKLSGDADMARELVQETTYRVLRDWKQYDRSRRLRPWFFAILRNTFLGWRKRLKQQKWVALDAPLEGHSAVSYCDILSDRDSDPADTIVTSETVNQISEAISRLSPEHRDVLLYGGPDGTSYEQIARSLGIPVGTVRSRLSRARRILRNRCAALA